MSFRSRSRRGNPRRHSRVKPDPTSTAGRSEERIQLYQPSLILTPFTPWLFGLIFVASQERVAPRCQTPHAPRDAAGDKKRPALAGGAHRPAGCPVAPMGGACPPFGTRGPASRRAPRPCLRFAPNGPGGPMCPMKRVNINDLWYYAASATPGGGALPQTRTIARSAASSLWRKISRVRD